MLFLDTDMVWDVKDIFKLVHSDHDICAIDYRKKCDDEMYTGSYTGREREGWAEAYFVGAGLLCITRAAIEKMIVNYPETQYLSDDGVITFALFAEMIIDGRFYTEDTTFCKRWRDCGGDIIVLKDAATSHVGNKNYKGNLNDFSKTPKTRQTYCL